MHLHVAIKSLISNDAGLVNYCAVFQRVVGGEDFNIFECEVRQLDQAYSSNRRASNNKMAMLVGITEGLKNSEVMPWCQIPSVIGLQPLNDCLSLWRDKPNFIETASISGMTFGLAPGNLLVELLPIGENGEFSASNVKINAVHSGMGDRELVDEMVQNGAHVIQDIPSDSAQAEWWMFKNIVKNKQVELVLPFRFELGVQSYRITPQIDFDFAVECIQVLLRSVEFNGNLINRCHDSNQAEETKDSEGLRDSGSDERGIREELGQGNEDSQAITPSSPVQVESQTAPSRDGGYTAKHTRLGSLEDA